VHEEWEKLITVLEESVILYKNLLVLGEEKRQTLVEAKAAAIDEVNRREELIVLEGTRLEERRAKVTAVLATRYNLPELRPTLSVLAGLAAPDIASRIKTIGAELDAVAKRLVRLNEINGALVRQALQFVHYNLNLLTQSQAETTYVASGGRGAPEKSKASVILDRKV
jgi:flagellar biosynthesis/type III secretory pathway chaperone